MGLFDDILGDGGAADRAARLKRARKMRRNAGNFGAFQQAPQPEVALDKELSVQRPAEGSIDSKSMMHNAGASLDENIVDIFDAQLAKGIKPKFVPRYGHNYILHKKLGQGGMGAVYDAEICESGNMSDPSHPRCVLKFASETGDVAREQGLDREINTCREVVDASGTKGIVDVVHVLHGKDYPVRAIHYKKVQGDNVEDIHSRFLEDGQMIHCDVSMLELQRVAKEFAVLHKNGVAHRDAGGNIMIQKNGEPRVFDLGLAYSRLPVPGTPNAGQRPATEHIEGKLMDLAPETIEKIMETAQLMSRGSTATRPTIDWFANDMYTLGTRWYFLLTGTFPYPDSIVSEVYHMPEADWNKLNPQQKEARKQWFNGLKPKEKAELQHDHDMKYLMQKISLHQNNDLLQPNEVAVDVPWKHSRIIANLLSTDPKERLTANELVSVIAGERCLYDGLIPKGVMDVGNGMYFDMVLPPESDDLHYGVKMQRHLDGLKRNVRTDSSLEPLLPLWVGMLRRHAYHEYEKNQGKHRLDASFKRMPCEVKTPPYTRVLDNPAFSNVDPTVGFLRRTIRGAIGAGVVELAHADYEDRLKALPVGDQYKSARDALRAKINGLSDPDHDKGYDNLREWTRRGLIVENINLDNRTMMGLVDNSILKRYLNLKDLHPEK